MCEPESSPSGSALLQVGFCEGLELQGGTPAFMPALLTFNHVMRAWHENGVTVERVHQHVMGLQQEFCNAFWTTESSDKRKRPPQHMAPEAVRSHSLVRKTCWASASASVSNLICAICECRCLNRVLQSVLHQLCMPWQSMAWV